MDSLVARPSMRTRIHCTNNWAANAAQCALHADHLYNEHQAQNR